MAHDALVAWVADSSPEVGRPWTIGLDQHGNPPNAPLREHLLDPPNKLSPEALATTARIHDEAIHVAAPTVIGTKQRANDLIADCSEKKDGSWIRSDTPNLLDLVGHADACARLFPETKYRLCVVWSCVPEFGARMRHLTPPRCDRESHHITQCRVIEFGEGRHVWCRTNREHVQKDVPYDSPPEGGHYVLIATSSPRHDRKAW